MSSAEMKGRDWCELPSAPLVDETERGIMCWMHICAKTFATWQGVCAYSITISRALAEAWVVLLMIFINHDIATCMMCGFTLDTHMICHKKDA